MMKWNHFFLLILLVSQMTQAEVKCSRCGFSNSPEDRYCMNCSFEIKTLSPEKKEYFENINQKRVAEAEKIRIQKKESQKTANDSVPSDEGTTTMKKMKNRTLILNRFPVRLGAKKNLLRKNLDYASSSFPFSGDTWKILSAKGLRTTFLFFQEGKLTRWDTTVKRDYFISRPFPLKKNDLSIGLEKDTVVSKWGKADLKKETYSASSYSLVLEYYIEAPRPELERKERSSDDNPLKHSWLQSGTVLVLRFDENLKLVSMEEKTGSTREVKHVMGDFLP